MRQEFMKAVTAEDMAAVARAMIDKAKEGDAAAARIVLQYTLGRPAETIDPDRLDEMEWQQWRRESQVGEFDEVCRAMTASSANDLARILVPFFQQQHFEGFKSQIDERTERRQQEAARSQREAERRARRKARHEAQKAAPVHAAPAVARQESVPASPPNAETAGQVEGSVGVSPIGTHEIDGGGQEASGECREAAVAKVMLMLESTVNKRVETAQRAANGFVD
jgi:hypothetical protein